MVTTTQAELRQDAKDLRSMCGRTDLATLRVVARLFADKVEKHLDESHEAEEET